MNWALVKKSNKEISKNDSLYLINLCYVIQLKNILPIKNSRVDFKPLNHISEEPCTSGTTPIISHCPTIVGEGSGTGVTVMRSMQKTNSEDSTSSCDESPVKTVNACH